MMNDDNFCPLSIESDISSVSTIFETKEDKIIRLEIENKQLREELGLERSSRYTAERQVEELQLQIAELQKPQKRKRRPKREMEDEEKEYCEFKSDGKRKSRPAESIRSYKDFVSIQSYFLDGGKIRDWALWTIGVSLGLRISDLLSLKIKDLLNDDFSFRERILVIEQKTNKANNCLITEAVMNAAKTYFDSIEWNFTHEDYLFRSNKTKGKMHEEYGWKILSDAGKSLNLPIIVGSHTMRKSFANIAACVDKSAIDMNSITKIQGLLNHSDQRVTMRYLGTYQKMFDKARIAVSDFVLGRTNIDELVAGNNFTLDDIVAKIDALDVKISN